MSKYILDFENPLKEIEDKIDSLRKTSFSTGIDVEDSILDLENRLHLEKEKIYLNLTRWQKVQLARHPDRPYSKDYIEAQNRAKKMGIGIWQGEFILPEEWRRKNK